MTCDHKTAQMIGHLIEPANAAAAEVSGRLAQLNTRSADQPLGDRRSDGQMSDGQMSDGQMSDVLPDSRRMFAPRRETGDLSEPVSANFSTADATSTPDASTSKSPSPCYRIDKLLSQTVGKRIFLATDIYTHTNVVLKLLLFGADVAAEDLKPIAQSPEVAASLAYSAMLPYLTSFEVETPLGSGLVMVQPYVAGKQYGDKGDRSLVSLQGHPARRQSDRPFPKRPQNSAPKPVLNDRQTAIAPPTPKPQTINADFRVKSSFSQLEVQFLDRRLRGLLPVLTGGKVPVRTFPADDVDLMLLAIVSTIFFVGGTVVATGSIFLAVVVAAILPGLYVLLFSGKKAKPTKKVILRLKRTHDDRVQLSLTTQTLRKRNTAAAAKAWSGQWPVESTLHFVNSPVYAVKAFSFVSLRYGLCARLRFTLTEKMGDKTHRVSIIGSHQEIQWLRNHLTAWATRK